MINVQSPATIAAAPTGTLSPADCVCITVGVTAHRDLESVDQTLLRKRVREFFESLQASFPALPIKLLNSLAEGGDRLVAEVATELGISMIILLPMPAAEYEKDFSSEASLAQFRNFCALHEVSELPLYQGNTLESIAADPAARSAQYAELGVFLSSHSQILLALWDGEAGHKIGGTSSVIHFRLHEDMPGFIDPQDTAQLLADHENALIYHILCPRNPGAAGQDSLPGIWVSPEGEGRSDGMPARYSAIFENLQTFARDAVRYSAALVQHATQSGNLAPIAGDRELEMIGQLFAYADWLAVHFRQRVITGFRITHTIAVLMGLCFIMFSEYDGLDLLLPAFLALFFFAWAVTRLTASREWHRKYLDYRALAEGLRVQYYWSLGGVEGSRSNALAYDNMLQKQDVELAWIRHIMRIALVLRVVPTAQDDARLNMAIEQWVGNREATTGQMAYYQRTASNREQQFRRTGLITRACLWLGIGTAVVMLLGGATMPDSLHTPLLVLMGVLPLIAGVREAYAFKKADRELVKQYRFMAHLFSRARQKLEEAESAATRRKLLRALGEACLEEHAEWLLMHRERPIEHPGLQT
jgi:hypothetical protein